MVYFDHIHLKNGCLHSYQTFAKCNKGRVVLFLKFGFGTMSDNLTTSMFVYTCDNLMKGTKVLTLGAVGMYTPVFSRFHGLL